MLLLILPVYAFAENVVVGTWDLHGFKMLYAIPEGEIVKVTSDYETNEYDIYYKASKDTVLEILLPVEIFHDDVWEYYSENNFVFEDTILGISENQEIISFTYQIPAGSNHITIYSIDDDFFDTSYGYQRSWSIDERTKEVFENDITVRMQTNENSKRAYELTIEAEHLMVQYPPNYEKILELYDESIKADSDFFDSWQGKQSILLGLGEYESALENIEKFDQTYGFESNFQKGQIYLLLGNYDEALTLFKNGLDASPDYDTLYNIVSWLFEFDLEEDAKDIILYFYEYNSDYDKGVVLQEFGFYEDSIKFLDASIQSDPNDYFGYVEKANSLYYLGNYDDSLKNSEHAISINPMESYAYVLKADALQAIGNFEESIKNYNTAIAIFSDYDYAYGEQSMAYLSIGDLDSALQSIERAIEIYPENDYHHQAKSWILIEQEEYDSALQSIERAIEIYPENDYYYAIKAYILFSLGNLDGAQLFVNTALQMNPYNEYAYNVNGLLALENKDFTTAVENFESSLEIYPDDENVQSLRNYALSEIGSTKQTSNSDDGGGCLIATATYGSELSPQVQQLRELRDNSLLQTESGTNFMNLFNDAYYSFSPVIADYERENPIFKEMVKVAITPMISSLSILNYVDMDSESSVLGYGISLIILNGLMYVGIPASVIVVIRRF